MTNRRTFVGQVAAGLLAAALIVPTAAAAEPAATVVVDGLDNPRGIDIGANGTIVVAETGGGRVLRVRTNGTTSTVMSGLPSLVTEEGATGVHNVSLTGNGNLFILTGEAEAGTTDPFWTLFRKPITGGKARVVAEIDAYQATDPDPTDVDQPPFPTQSNPYGLESVGGARLVTDAGNNDLLLVGPKGGVQTVARFPIEIVATDHLPFDIGAAFIPAEAVPTTVAIGPDGAWYVGELKGFPFRPGSSNIWRIEPWARGATCDDDTSDGCSRWATGFTAITGMEFAPDGTLWVASMVKGGLFGFFSGGDSVGALWHVDGATRTEVAEGELHLLGDVAVSKRGAVYVTTGSVTTDGAVVRIHP
ncbi:MAG TPA: ScyD/ScyE family protein [Candidatus Saccharimonadales bacterium]|nr:ScyD/ScyE family protein [Candidatus Saccharimonadales bacterium]